MEKSKKEYFKRSDIKHTPNLFWKIKIGTDAKVLDHNIRGYSFYIKFIGCPPENIDGRSKILTYSIQVLFYNGRLRMRLSSRNQIIQRID